MMLILLKSSLFSVSSSHCTDGIAMNPLLKMERNKGNLIEEQKVKPLPHGLGSSGLLLPHKGLHRAIRKEQ